MKQLVVLSGKGGTGKTTVAAALIRLSNIKTFADCDVDAPNLHLIYSTDQIPIKENFLGYKKAVKYNDLCTNCGQCERLCRFGAIHDGQVNPYECEGCGVCEVLCPSKDQNGNAAIRLVDNVSGETMIFNTNKYIFSTAELNMGNGASGKLVMQVRKNLYNSAKEPEVVIIDGSPGIGCPVIASITGVDMVLVVAEPTESGIHDMKRIVETANKFGTKVAVCINKFDINPSNTKEIENFCEGRSIPMVGIIPFDPNVIKAVNSGKTVADIEGCPAGEAIKEIWNNINKLFLI